MERVTARRNQRTRQIGRVVLAIFGACGFTCCLATTLIADWLKIFDSSATNRIAFRGNDIRTSVAKEFFCKLEDEARAGEFCQSKRLPRPISTCFVGAASG